MNYPKRNWTVSENFNHSLAPAMFACEFAKARAKSLGLPWKCKVRVENSASSGQWYGHAYGRRGRGRIFCRVNCSVPPSDHRDRRYVNQPRYPMWGTEETICFLFAHEFGHIIGWGGDKAGEMACNKFAYECVIAWRGRQYDCPACLI